MHLGCEIFQTSNNQRQCCLEGLGIDALLPLRLRLGDTTPQAEDTGLKLLRVHEAVRLTVKKPREPLAQLPAVRCHRRTRRVLGGRFWLSPTPVCLSEALGMGEPR